MKHDHNATMKVLSIMSSVMAVCVGVLIVAVAMIVGPAFENKYMPVMRDWSPGEVQNSGNDIVIMGTVRKARDCTYIPGLRVRDHKGQHLVITSRSPTADKSWMSSDVHQVFGPWVVVNGAGKRLTFYQEHVCHPLWHTFSELGTIDMSVKQ